MVDVFAEHKYEGNQLAVVRNAADLSDEQMLRITKEMNYSETTFILSDGERNGGYDVRIFTPATEVPFAGHPTLGTAFVIRHHIAKQPIDTIKLNLKVGPIPVTFEKTEQGEDILWMRQIEPTFAKMVDAGPMSQVLGIGPQQIDDRFPIQKVSTGLFTTIVPVKSLDTVQKIKVNKDKYYELIEKITTKAILVFCPETYHEHNHLNVRVFCDYYGVPEDPATGSSNGCLAGYLVKHRYFGSDPIDIRVEQGYEIGRPSLLYLRAVDRGKHIDVSVGGKVVLVAEGRLF
jgi:trans-2,3-dihydro-3-hydroxyanthranilate isomerase